MRKIGCKCKYENWKQNYIEVINFLVILISEICGQDSEYRIDQKYVQIICIIYYVGLIANNYV